ncbi:MAG: hypothetical protein M1828_004720 [Chrysothrix sp. TS-e1954]|nr:MAG: hypothetical protein M1828_004720 [Chrysothrix sp. TS-e1954]
MRSLEWGFAVVFAVQSCYIARSIAPLSTVGRLIDLFKGKLSQSHASFHHSKLGFTWKSIEPSPQLMFHPCYDRFECARLELPLTYDSSGHEEETIALALVRLPAKVPLDDPRHGGVVVIQPGGPGASGVDFLLNAGSDFQIIVDAAADPNSPNVGDGAKYFDLLAFDPRGVMRSTPFHTCMQDPVWRHRWDTETSSMVYGAKEHTYELMLARQEALSRSCYYDPIENPNGSKISSYMGTMLVVDDLSRLLQRYSEWKDLERSSSGAQSGANPSQSRIVVKPEPLRFWGFSYATVIGATFAARFPHGVERLVLDGVVDADDYWRGDWEHSVLDADKLVLSFTEYCAEATTAECPFKEDGDTSETLLQRLTNIEDRLFHDGPLSVPISDGLKPQIVTWSDFKNLLWWATYVPIAKWYTLALILKDLASGSGAELSRFNENARQSSSDIKACPLIDPYDPDCALGNFNPRLAWQAVQCPDGDPARTATLDKAGFDDYAQRLKNQSVYLGEPWAWLRFTCLGWRGRAFSKWQGSVTSNELSDKILWIGNARDNVTPLRNAFTMAGRFPGTHVLEIDGDGHTSLVMPSLCVARKVRGYFQGKDSEVESKGCLPIARPLLGTRGPRVETQSNNLTHEDRTLRNASEGLLNAVP